MSNDIRLGGASLPQAALAASQAVRPAAPARVQPVQEPESAARTAKPDNKEMRRALQEAAEHLNRQMTRSSRDLSFSVDDVADTVVITVKNSESGEVVRQIPSEVALRVAHNLDDIKGLLEDKKS